MPIHGASLITRTLSRALVGLINVMIVVSYTGWENKRSCAESIVTSEITKDAAKTRRVKQNSTPPMFSQPSTFHTPDNMADRTRQPLGHSASQSSLHASFSVGGISSTTGTHHPHGPSSWASSSQNTTLSNSLNDPFLQSRSSYQSGYLIVCNLLHGVWSPLFTFMYL